MCTLAFAWAVFDGFSVAATREEAYGRPSSPPAYRDWERRVLCPRDEEAGGTWIGVSDAGLFVALTNRPAGTEGERSRGLLVRDALAEPTAAAARAVVEDAVAEQSYAGFNLVVADATGRPDEPASLLFTYDGSLQMRSLAPGVHVVVNEGYDDGTEKSARIRAALTALDASDADAWRRLAGERLSDHALGACLHGERGGTVSASRLTVAADGTTYEFAPGPPCETPFERVEGHF